MEDNNFPKTGIYVAHTPLAFAVNQVHCEAPLHASYTCGRSSASRGPWLSGSIALVRLGGCCQAPGSLSVLEVIVVRQNSFLSPGSCPHVCLGGCCLQAKAPLTVSEVFVCLLCCCQAPGSFLLSQPRSTVNNFTFWRLSSLLTYKHLKGRLGDFHVSRQPQMAFSMFSFNLHIMIVQVSPRSGELHLKIVSCHWNHYHCHCHNHD